MNWVVLLLAGLLEIVWAVGMKYSEGFTRLWPSVLTILAMLGSFAGLAYAMRTLPLGTAYVIWTGIGAVGSVIVGILCFGEAATFSRIACVILIVAGILGLKLMG